MRAELKPLFAASMSEVVDERDGDSGLTGPAKMHHQRLDRLTKCDWLHAWGERTRTRRRRFRNDLPASLLAIRWRGRRSWAQEWFWEFPWYLNTF